MSETIMYYGGMRLDNLLKATAYGTSVKVISGKNGRVLLRDVRNGDKNHDYYWGIEVYGIHTEMTIDSQKSYVRAQIVCYTNEDEFYRRKSGAFFEERLAKSDA